MNKAIVVYIKKNGVTKVHDVVFQHAPRTRTQQSVSCGCGSTQSCKMGSRSKFRFAV